MPQYTKDNMILAIRDIANGKSLKLAAKEWGIPFSLLRNRIQGTETHSIAAES